MNKPSLSQISPLMRILAESSIAQHIIPGSEEHIFGGENYDKLRNMSIKQYKYILHCLQEKKMLKLVEILKTLGIKFKEYEN